MGDRWRRQVETGGGCGEMWGCSETWRRQGAPQIDADAYSDTRIQAQALLTSLPSVEQLPLPWQMHSGRQHSQLHVFTPA